MVSVGDPISQKNATSGFTSLEILKPIRQKIIIQDLAKGFNDVDDFGMVRFRH